MSRVALFVLVGCLVSAFAGVARADDPGGDPGASPGAGPWRIMTFNIRFGSADDGPDSWGARRGRVTRTIERHAADIIALQEPFAFQVVDLLEDFPRYAAIGTHRLDGRTSGEGCVTLYDRARFTVASSGVFWLSDTPDVPGSISWDNAWPRSCTWARLIELGSGRGVYVYNVHLDNRGGDSRLRGARQIRDHFERVTAGPRADDPVVVLGDFNAVPGSPPIRALIGEPSGRPRLADAYLLPASREEVGTYTGFDLASDGGERRIDLILVSPRLNVLDALIDSSKVDGRYPSDHFPMWVDVMPPEAPAPVARPNR